MAWTPAKIQALLLRVAPAKAATNLRPVTANKPGRAPSPRSFAAGTSTGYGRK